MFGLNKSVRVLSITPILLTVLFLSVFSSASDTPTADGGDYDDSFLMKTYIQDNLDYRSDDFRDFLANYCYNAIECKHVTANQTDLLSLPWGGAIENPRHLPITESQAMHLFSKTRYDSSDRRLEAQNARATYEISFNSSLPLCLDITKNQSSCPDADLLTKNRIKLYFLRDTFVAVPFSGKTWRLNGSQITGASIAREADYNSFMVVGDSFTLRDGTKIILEHIGLDSKNNTFAAFSSTDASHSREIAIKLYPLESKKLGEYELFLWGVTRGALGGTDYATVSVFSNRLFLEQNQKIAGARDWRVEMHSQNVGASEGLSGLVVYDPLSWYYLAAGESFKIIPGIPGFKFGFDGLDLATYDYDQLQFTLNKNATIYIAPGRTLSGDLIQVSSQISNAFYRNASDTNGVSSVFVLANPLSTANDGRVSYVSGTIFYMNSSWVYNNWGNATTVFLNQTSAARSNKLTYFFSPFETAEIRFLDAVNQTSGALHNDNAFIIAVPEGTEDADVSSFVGTSANGDPYWTTIYDQNLRQFVNELGNPSIGVTPFGYEAHDARGYAYGNGIYGAVSSAFAPVSFANQANDYLSYRGSKAWGFGQDSVSVKYAKKLAHALYSLSRGN